ncbi:MAG: twin-arginine translocase TatA/TatE family subunit [Candidatus Omnitrophota bacterium]|nr:twin-arginine translocase TatA/TatE family subunit [Candidatus Omnitrophota bacterium]MDZ4243150.1 twin-arginine translocase TatA/TatE family subunit [Candidatus Omnitrophota bacterium]
MGRIGVTELLLVLVVVLILFGAKRLPEIGSAIGKALREFKKSARDIEGDVKEPLDDKDKGPRS